MDVDEESVASFYEQRTPSVYSFSSSRDGNALLRSIEGRTFNAQNDLYFLPAGEDLITPGAYGRHTDIWLSQTKESSADCKLCQP